MASISVSGKEDLNTDSAPVLHLVRLPGEFGPILRCGGQLTVATTEALRREIALLDSLDHPVIILNLAGCRGLDVEGMLAVLDCCRQLREHGRRLVVVAGNGAAARLLRVMGMDWVLPVFPTEEAAMLALRNGWPRLPGPETWTQAHAETVVRWHVIQDALEPGHAEGAGYAPKVGEGNRSTATQGGGQRDDLLRLLTSMTALCERSEEILQEHEGLVATGFPPPSEAGLARCHFCPLFKALGGQQADLGCRSLLDPIIAAVKANNLPAARAQVLAVIETLQRIPLSVEEPKLPRTA
jgi:anti-anti-sigma factor